MKCQICKTDIDDKIIDDAWSTCPKCDTRLMGFRYDMMQTAMTLIMVDIKTFTTRLELLGIRMYQITRPENTIQTEKTYTQNTGGTK